MNNRINAMANLLVDMTLKDAGVHEIEKVVIYSMAIIDAEKKLESSYEDNSIESLKKKYQC